MPVLSSLYGLAECATLECLDSFVRGRERTRGCKVGVTKNNRRYFYMVYTKRRRSQVNSAITEESRGNESWNGPLVVMRLDTASATRLVSITSRSHREIAIQAAAKYVFHSLPYATPTEAIDIKVLPCHERQDFGHTIGKGEVAAETARRTWLARLNASYHGSVDCCRQELLT